VEEHTRTFTDVFRVCAFLTAALRLGVAAELYERICEHFPGIGKFRFGLVSLLILIAAVAAISVFRPSLAAQWMFPQTLVTVVRRFQGEIFSAVLLFVWIFLRHVLDIPQSFRPNVLIHWRIATIYFGVSGLHALAILFTGGGSAVHPINSAMLAADIVCFVAWIRLMHSTGEQVPWFQRLSAGEIKTVEDQTQELLGTVRSLPRAISDELARN
jgi:hypothetical protein